MKLLVRPVEMPDSVMRAVGRSQKKGSVFVILVFFSLSDRIGQGAV